MHVIGHHSCPVLTPKNMLAAFDTAATRFDWAEPDVRRYGFGELAAVHDKTPDHVIDAPGRVIEAALTELQALITDDSGELISTLATVFSALSGRVPVNVELKERGLIDDLAAVVSGAEHEILTSSLGAEAFREAREVTTLSVAFLSAADRAGSLSVAADLDCAAIHPYYDLFSSVRAEETYDCGFEVNAWTVPGREIVWRLREYGVDGVAADDPVLVK